MEYFAALTIQERSLFRTSIDDKCTISDLGDVYYANGFRALLKTVFSVNQS
jgi:hypothetical protein